MCGMWDKRAGRLAGLAPARFDCCIPAPCPTPVCREQYGEPVCVLDLVKRVERRPRESVLGREYATAIRWAWAGCNRRV